MSKPSKLPRYEVRVGQIWRDCDKREDGRKVMVERVDEKYAYCVAVDYHNCPMSWGKTRIRLDRFVPTSTGWELERGAALAEQP